MEFQQERVVTCSEADRLSSLPNNLIDLILERLPIRDAARTSILSTKWRYIWNTLPVLVFDRQFLKETFYRQYIRDIRNFGAFISIVNQVLFHHNGPILKFILHLPELPTPAGEYDMYQELNQWMSYLSKHGVKELIVTRTRQSYELPSCVFSCSQLTTLKVENCIFKTPSKFEGFSNLKTLSLRRIVFGVNRSGTIGNFPNLQKLTLSTCTEVHNFDINAAKLSCLWVIDCQDAISPLLVKNQYLIMVTISLSGPVQPFDQKINLGKLLCDLKNLKYLVIGGCLLELFAEKIPDRLPNEVTHLNHLRLTAFQFSNLNHVRSVLCFLRSSPNLRRLVVSQEYRMRNVYDDERAMTLLDVPNCLEQSLNQLHTVEVNNIEGSMIELLFIKLILAESPSLRNLVIQPREYYARFGVAGNFIRSKIARDVMPFPRASPNAEIIYMDPQ